MQLRGTIYTIQGIIYLWQFYNKKKIYIFRFEQCAKWGYYIMWGFYDAIHRRVSGRLLCAMPLHHASWKANARWAEAHAVSRNTILESTDPEAPLPEYLSLSLSLRFYGTDKNAPTTYKYTTNRVETCAPFGFWMSLLFFFFSTDESHKKKGILVTSSSHLPFSDANFTLTNNFLWLIYILD